MSCPAESCVQGYVAGSDKERYSGKQDQTEGDRRSIIDELIANDAIEQQNPYRCYYSSKVDCRKHLEEGQQAYLMRRIRGRHVRA